MKTTTKPAAQPNTTAITLAAMEGPEALRHEDLWTVATKSGRERPWTMVAALNGEHLARLVFEQFRTSGALCAIIPPTDAGVIAVPKGAMHARARVSYVARQTQPVELWNDGKRVA